MSALPPVLTVRLDREDLNALENIVESAAVKEVAQLRTELVEVLAEWHAALGGMPAKYVPRLCKLLGVDELPQKKP